MFKWISNRNNGDEEGSGIEAERRLMEIVSELQGGSAEAFQILYNKYQMRVYSFCLRILADESAAKDAFQETFIKVYEKRSSFRGDNFQAWLFTIARHTCYNIIRTRRDFDEYAENHQVDTKLNNVDHILKDHIEDAIASLPLLLREALVLREYDSYSYQEIADLLEIDLSLAKVRVHRARILLRKTLLPVAKEYNEN